MKRILFVLMLACSFIAKAQVYNNEWIDYSKTYYKFKVGKTGLYRIPQALLAANGMATAPAEQFQLWRNGVQIPIYTSLATGSFSTTDYIEFWGQMNDGKPDKELYRVANYQLNDHWSLETDTASYFLTLNPVVVNNLRLQTVANDVAANTLPAEAYFMHKAGKYYKDQLNKGYAVNVGDDLYSSSYDKGEGWSSNDINMNNSVSFTLNNLQVFPGGPAPSIKVGISGNDIKPRRYKVMVNSDSVLGNEVDFFNHVMDTSSFSLSAITSGTATISIFNYTNCTPSYCPTSDRMVVHQCEITYPRTFDFGGYSTFEFSLPASVAGNFLQISNLAYSASIPVLYDLTNGKRYLANISGSLLQFALQPSATDRNLVLVSESSSDVAQISSMQMRKFIDYSSPANSGDYLIISHPYLFNGTNGVNPVESYRAYRSSAIGGGYTAKIFLSDELIDQFGFGIKKNPAGIRNFIRYARERYPVTPKHVFIIGKGVNYRDQRGLENASLSDQVTLSQLNLIPPFGAPASDALLSAEPGSSAPKTPIGRLSAISAQEVEVYLSKIKEHEQAQANTSPSVSDKAWMKNVVHIVGASEPGLQAILDQYMTNYKRTISDTLFGAKVSTFTKTSSDAVETLSATNLQELFSEGISLITYFGHSSASTLEFNLDNPENYNNNGKYPVFIGLGCNAGNFFTYNPLRFTTKETLSERFILAPNKGTIGFIASTHFGIVHYLDIWNSRAYKELTGRGYGKTLGEVMVNTISDVFDLTTEDDFYARSNAEETELHGDPAIRINPFPKADYVVEDPMVRITPGFISVAENSFKVITKIQNLGKAPNIDIVVETKRTYPDGTTAIVSRDTIPGVRFADSLEVRVPIDPTHDKGLNKITVTVDADNAVDELYETNNSITKEVMIYEDEARPVFPYNFAIINKPTIILKASTANPFAPVKDYRMELDTTELFNSPFKITKNTTVPGGIMEFDPGISFRDSTVYYWRVAPIVDGSALSWNTSSFIYLANSEPGFNQSHIFQHLKSGETKLTLDSASKTWKYGTAYQNFFIKQGSWITSGATQEAALSVAVNSVATIRLTCWFQSLVFNVFDATTFKPLFNKTIIPNGSNPSYPLGAGLFESTDPECYGQPAKELNFEFRYTDTSSRRKIMDFMRNHIPDNSYVIVRNFTLDESVFGGFPVAYIKDWMADTAYYGAGQSLYHYLKNAGLSSIDSFYRVRPFALVYKKGGTEPFSPKWVMGDGAYDNPTLTVDVPTSDTIGFISSPVFGPAKAWKELKWRGASLEGGTGDNPIVNILGITSNGQVDTLYNDLNMTKQNFDLSAIDAKMYPYVQLRMRNTDTVDYTPYQLRYWRLTYSPAPEGAVAPNLLFKMKDTVDVAEPINLKLAFKNISEAVFGDSLRIKAVVTDKNNVQHVIPTSRVKPLGLGDTLNVNLDLDTRQLVGANSLYLEVNPDNDQVEQYRFNNFIYKTFYVRPDTLNPIMDVTFDNVHILNHDIVSSKPNVQIKIKDDAKWFLLNDTSVVSVQVRYPNNTIRSFNFNSDTMQLVPAQQAPNGDNTASINMKPYFPEDGEYELIVSGKDMSQNKAGAVQYRVAFQVINKPMISNMLNYPNPFTTSTAFVFTVTGSEVPQNIRIQILTITGKVVREITKEELGPIHIGRNITEYKWDGKDQYGQELANGVYLYRVITNLNGKSLDQYKADGDNTDKYFNKGYGKMYKMR